MTGKVRFGRVVVPTFAMALATGFVASPAHAQTFNLVINEIETQGTDWVELYNPTSSPISLKGWSIKDDKAEETLPAKDSVPAGGLYVYEPELGLGKSDEVSLLNGGKTVDKYSWSSHGPYARTPDGTGNFKSVKSTSRGEPNDPKTFKGVLESTGPEGWPKGLQIKDLKLLADADWSGADFDSEGNLWVVNNGTATLAKLTYSGNGSYTVSRTWTMQYPNGSGTPDAEGVTIGPDGAIYVATERDNGNNKTSRPSVLRYVPTSGGGRLRATNEWNFERIANVSGSNGGLEAISYIPDYGENRFAVGVEETGEVLFVELDPKTNSPRLLQRLKTPFSGVMALDYRQEEKQLRALCDDACNGQSILLEFESGSQKWGPVSEVESRPAKLGNTANEGYASYTVSGKCVAGKSTVTTRFAWVDDGESDGVSIRTAEHSTEVECKPEPTTPPAIPTTTKKITATVTASTVTTTPTKTAAAVTTTPTVTTTAETVTVVPTTTAPTVTTTPTEVAPTVTTTPTKTAAAVTTTPTEIAPTVTTTPTEIAPAVTTTPTEIAPAVTTTPTEIAPTVTTTPTKTAAAVTTTPTEIAPTVTTTPTEIAPTVTTTPTEIAPTVTTTPTEIAPTVTTTPTVIASTVTTTPTEIAPTVTTTPTEIAPTVTTTPTKTAAAVTTTPTKTAAAVTTTPTNTAPAVTTTPTVTTTAETVTVVPTTTADAVTTTPTEVAPAVTTTPTVTTTAETVTVVPTTTADAVTTTPTEVAPAVTTTPTVTTTAKTVTETPRTTAPTETIIPRTTADTVTETPRTTAPTVTVVPTTTADAVTTMPTEVASAVTTTPTLTTTAKTVTETPRTTAPTVTVVPTTTADAVTTTPTEVAPAVTTTPTVTTTAKTVTETPRTTAPIQTETPTETVTAKPVLTTVAAPVVTKTAEAVTLTEKPSAVTTTADAETITETPAPSTTKVKAQTVTETPGEVTITAATPTVTDVPAAVTTTRGDEGSVEDPLLIIDDFFVATVGRDVEEQLEINGIDIEELPEDAVSVEGLPEGLRYDAATRRIIGIPEVTGTATATVQLADGNVARTGEIRIAVIAPATVTETAEAEASSAPESALEVLVPRTAAGTVGRPLEIPVRVVGEGEVTVDGLPEGLTFDNEKSRIHGAPTAAGESTAVISIDDGEQTASAELQISVEDLPTVTVTPEAPSEDGEGKLAISSVSGTKNEPLKVQLGLEGVENVEVTGLPRGLRYDAQLGAITGRPEESGTFEVVVVTQRSDQKLETALNLEVAEGRHSSETEIVTVTPTQTPVPGAENTGSTKGSSISDRCIAALAGWGVPLIALVPLAAISQVGLPVAPELKATIDSAMRSLNEQFGGSSNAIGQQFAIDPAFQKQLGQAGGVLGGIAIAALVVGTIANACAEGEGSSR